MSWLKKFLPLGEERRQGVGFGFQVLKNTNNLIAIEPWFDFICGINGRLVEDGNSYLFSKEIENCAGRDVAFTVWSAKGQRMRDVMASVPSSSLSLGLTLQWCPVATTEDIWHILDVAPNSPADYAGLLPYSDYIIGTPEGIVRGESGLGELVEDHMDRPLRLFVYNHEYDVTRELHITPTRSWGGEGALGCVLGFGALHRIPAPLHEPVQAPGETLFSNSPRASGDFKRPPVLEEEEFPPTEPGNLIAPATTTTPSPYQFTPMENPATFRGTIAPASHLFTAAAITAGTPPPPRSTSSPVPARHKARHARDFDSSLMDDYLKEGEQKSRELEGTSSKPIKTDLPPPPKRAVPPPQRKPATPTAEVPAPVTTPEREDELD
ncbi:GRASP55/65 PDZ-like domain-containing protein [Sphaerosporella brunnea]|uniref:GRASP55/65 PDZ-like domain-containing protein n=1 Tax=Sphaerosporella brunnea TaxID=1250544 RepID=A0A5J5F1Q5_9PEZI|nr:GRASP55/65 PDZ-like domain-containing protein [Sphaerosporella brunnea]